MTKLLIINADDYGLTDGICDAINDLSSSRAITNTTMMLCAHGAADRISQKLNKAVRTTAGVHLQLTSGTPVSPKYKVPSLIDKKGAFKDPRRHAANVREVNIEWRAQIELAIKLLGHSPTHIDSHHGMHRLPALFPVYKAIAQDYNLPFRGTINKLRDEIIAHNLRGTSAIVRDWTSSCTGALGLMSEIDRVAGEFPSSTAIEVVAHPGTSDPTLRQISSLNDKRECDLHGLIEAHKTKIFEEGGYKMAGFSEVTEFARSRK